MSEDSKEQELIIEDYETYTRFRKRDFLILIIFFVSFQIFIGILALVFKWPTMIFATFFLIGIGITLLAAFLLGLKMFSDLLYLAKSGHIFLVNLHNIFYESLEEEEDADHQNTKKSSSKKH